LKSAQNYDENKYNIATVLWPLYMSSTCVSQHSSELEDFVQHSFTATTSAFGLGKKTIE